MNLTPAIDEIAALKEALEEATKRSESLKNELV